MTIAMIAATRNPTMLGTGSSCAAKKAQATAARLAAPAPSGHADAIQNA
jgi:hypothetical protein